MLSLHEELKVFKPKEVNTYEQPLDDLYASISDVENKISSIDKAGKQNAMVIELLKMEIEKKNDQIDYLRSELAYKEKYEEKFVKKVLAWLDEFDYLYRFVKSSQNKVLLDNMNSLMKVIRKELMEVGLEEIPTIGENFNPELHDCVKAVTDNTKNKYEVVEVIKKGYKLNGKVIRVASVVAVK